MEWDNLTYVEMADMHYGGVAFEAELAIDQKDVITAQRVKVKIAKLLFACLSGERTQPMIWLNYSISHNWFKGFMRQVPTQLSSYWL